ncbi:hypothetical protein JST97_24760 [bacterium]|nr:hypothetical protein [bacterium]
MDKQSNATWICAALSLPLIYLFSIGPVVFVVEKTGRSPDLLVRAYTPVIWLHDHTILQRPLEGYVDFWQGLSR